MCDTDSLNWGSASYPKTFYCPAFMVGHGPGNNLRGSTKSIAIILASAHKFPCQGMQQNIYIYPEFDIPFFLGHIISDSHTHVLAINLAAVAFFDALLSGLSEGHVFFFFIRPTESGIKRKIDFY